MSQARWLRLPGTRYRCVPLYISVDDFDPLARLFLEVLRYEHNVSRLVRAFGLTERVVEDVLGELIRRNRAVLIVQNGVKELRLLDDAAPTIMHEPGETLDIWQDEATGLILPAWIVDMYDQPRDDYGDRRAGAPPLELHPGPPLVERFLDGADAQLIEMLLRSDEELRHRDEIHASLDRLADRYRVRPQTLWLPVVDADIKGQSIPLITAENIPVWVARVWSVALRRDSFRGPGEEVGFHAAITAEEGLRVVHGWRTDTRLGAWRSSVERFLGQVPPPISGYELRSVREKQASLAGLLLSISRAELVELPRAQDENAWLQRVFDVSRNWVILLLPWAAQVNAAIDLVGQRVNAGDSLPDNLIVVLPPTFPAEHLSAIRATLQKLLGATGFACVIRRGWPSDGPSLAFGDWPEVWVRYAPRSLGLLFAGGSLAAEWLSVVQALPAIDGDDDRSSLEIPAVDLLHRLRIRRDMVLGGQHQQEARLGLGPEARSVAVALDDLRGFGESLLTAIVDPGMLLSDSPADLGVKTLGGSKFDRQRPLMQQVPFLSDHLDTLCHQLSFAPASPWAFWARLGFHELLPTFAAVLTEPSRRSVEGSIHILASGLSDEACSASVVELIERAVIEYGWTVQLGLSESRDRASEDIVDRVLSLLRSRIPSRRLRFWKLSRAAPAHALVLDDLVFIAGGDWLRSGLQQKINASNFGFAFESRDLAEGLRACFVGGLEIAPSVN